MLGAHAGHAAGHDLSALGNEALQLFDVLIIDGCGLLNAETANFASASRTTGTQFTIFHVMPPEIDELKR